MRWGKLGFSPDASFPHATSAYNPAVTRSGGDRNFPRSSAFPFNHFQTPISEL